MSSTMSYPALGDYAIATRASSLGRSESLNPAASLLPTLRITLVKGEHMHVPKTATRINVLSGRAWVSLRQMDEIVDEGKKLSLPGTRSNAIISTIGCQVVFFELVF